MVILISPLRVLKRSNLARKENRKGRIAFSTVMTTGNTRPRSSDSEPASCCREGGREWREGGREGGRKGMRTIVVKLDSCAYGVQLELCSVEDDSSGSYEHQDSEEVSEGADEDDYQQLLGGAASIPPLMVSQFFLWVQWSNVLPTTDSIAQGSPWQDIPQSVFGCGLSSLWQCWGQ